MDLVAHSIGALDWQVVLDQLAAGARTTLGAERARYGSLASTRAQALERYAAVQEVLALEAQGDSVPVGDVSDITAAVEQAARGGVLEHAALMAVASSLRGLWNLRHWIESRADDLPSLDQLAQPIAVDGELLYTLERAFDETGQLADDAWPELAELRTGIRATRRRIQSVLDELIRGDTLGDALQDRYVTERGGRFVVPIKSARRSHVGIVHDTSKSGETAFVEPSQVVEPQNRLAALQVQVRREEHRILTLLSSLVSIHHTAILEGLDAATEIDLASARAILGRKLRGCIPHVGTDGVLALQQARHPVLALRGVEVVPNDLTVDREGPGLVLTGPNAGGKTVALKTIGLAALFVRAGIPFPAREGSRVDWFDLVLADIGDLQTVEQDLSTFSGHLMLLNAMLECAAPGCLLLVDEMAVGTDPAQGAALARAALEAMVTAGARVVVTTHYLELKALAEHDSRFRLMGAQYLDGRPTWRLLPDLVGQSHALGVARRLGLSSTVLDRAEVLLGTQATELAALMERVEAEHQQVRARAQEQAERAVENEATQRDLERKGTRLEERRRRLERDVAQGFGQRLRKKETAVKRMIAALQANPGLRDAGRVLEELREVRDEVEHVHDEPEPEGKTPEDVQPGEAVILRSLRREGRVIAATPDGRVQVEVGSMRSWVKLEDLHECTRKREKPAATPKPRQGRGRRPPRKMPPHAASTEPDLRGVPTPGNSLDLRGKRLDEAITATESFLDTLLLRGEPVAFVLHGHGTGVLKKGLRRWAERSRYVESWRPGQEGEGGDAWTVMGLA